jgi:polyhydroxybutyrate depolymerase
MKLPRFLDGRRIGWIGAAAFLVLMATRRACHPRHQPETCDPAQAATWDPPDVRPRPQGPSPGCGKARPAHVAFRGTLQVDGLERAWLITTASPLRAGAPVPLIFVFHGSGGTAAGARSTYDLERIVAGRAVIVYPEGVSTEGSRWGLPGWDLRRSGIDLPFFDRMLDKIAEDHCIDLGRVFATGHSGGGWMTNRLGFLRRSRLRGIAPAAGGLSPGDCASPPLATLVVHASNDPSVPFADGMAAHDMWAKAAGCGSGSRPMGIGPCVLHEGCNPETPVGLCEHDQNHAYPAFASQAIWSFFDSLK